MSNMIELARSMSGNFDLLKKEPKYSLINSLKVEEVDDPPNVKFHIFSQEGR